MSGLASAGVDQVIGLVDKTAEAALDAIDATQNAGFETAQQVVNIGDKTVDAAMAEIREVKDRLVGLLKAYADAITAPLP
jgi:CHASE3 domain sensor protein